MDPQTQYLEKLRNYLPLLNHPKVHMQTLEKLFVFWSVNFVVSILSVENGKMLIDAMALFEFFKGNNFVISFDYLLKIFGSMTKMYLKRLPSPKSHVFECKKLAEDILQYFDINVVTFELKPDFRRIFSKSYRKRAHSGEVSPQKRIKSGNSILLNTHVNQDILPNIEYTDFNNTYDVSLEYMTNFEQSGSCNFEDGMTSPNAYLPQTIEYVGDGNILNNVGYVIPNQDNNDYKQEDGMTTFPELEIDEEYMKYMTQFSIQDSNIDLNGIY